MTTRVAGQAEPRARRRAGSAGVPVLTAKITAPGVPDWAVQRPRITELIAGRQAAASADRSDRPGGRG